VTENMHGVPSHSVKCVCHEHRLVKVCVNFGPLKLRLCETAKCILEEGGQDISCKFSFIQLVCLTIGPKSLPKRALHIVQSRASSFK